MNTREIAEFMAERFKPAHVQMSDTYSYREVASGLFAPDKTWGQHLIEQYMEDAQAFMLLLDSKRLEIREKPLT